tara:strand:+ start:1232 stop:2935 length:1704 start_codon:yes stop_codon:yes gene_type:complete
MSNTEYNKLFTKFYSDFFKFKSGKKSHLKCPGCDSNKRFIINDDTLVYSCGPSNDAKCGKQYTIKLPEYIHYRTLREIYEKNINGSFEYNENDILQYNLSELKQKMDIKNEFEKQNRFIKESSEDLKRLIEDYIKENKLHEYADDLKSLSELRYKNNIEKRKIMKSIKEDELNEPEKIALRKKYVELIKENDKFIELIKKLDQPENNFIVSKKAETIIHKKTDSIKVTKEVSEDSKETPKKESKEPKKSNCSKVHPPPPCPEGKEVPEGKNCCYNEKKKKKEPKSEPKEEPKSEPKKYTYDEQIKILTQYYSKVDPKKTATDIKRIVDRRKPPNSKEGNRILTKPWLELCEKLYQKYNVHPLKEELTKEELTKEDSSKSDKLYNPLIVFQFYSKSRDPEPGKGAGESIPEDKISEFKELSKIKDWRKMLSNFYESEFTLEGKKWLSVEHYYQGAKFKVENPEFYNKFSLDSDSDISKDPNLAKSAGGKSGKSKGKLLRPTSVKMDKDFFKNNRSSNEMKQAQREKYSQNPDLKKMLLLTKDAKLTHFSRGSPPIVFTETMELRKEFK